MADVLAHVNLTSRFIEGRDLFLNATDASRTTLIENMASDQANMLTQLDALENSPGTQILADLGQTTLSLHSLREEQSEATKELQRMTRYSYAELMGRRVSAQVIPGLEDDPITRFLFRSGGTFDPGRFHLHTTEPHPTSVKGRIR